MSYNFKCECGSVFMTAGLLASHKEKKACKPNQVYSLNMTVRPSKRRSAGKDKCPSCDGKGWITLGKIKGGARIGTHSRPCPQNCVPAQDEQEQFVRDCWAQVGTGIPGTFP
jgi:hypothetical protein